MRRFITLCLLWSLTGHDVVVRLPVLLVVVDVWLAGNCTGDRKCRDWRDLHILPGRAPSTLTAPHAHQQLISTPHPRSLGLRVERIRVRLWPPPPQSQPQPLLAASLHSPHHSCPVLARQSTFYFTMNTKSTFFSLLYFSQ